MMRLFLNASGASAGGGITYVRNILQYLAQAPGIQTTILVPPQLEKELPAYPNIAFSQVPQWSGGPLKRFWYEQRWLPQQLHQTRTDVLISAGNFALFRSPVPQILLTRNALYTSSDFVRELRARQDYRFWLDTALKTWLAKKSVQIADRVIAPSQAFAREVQQWKKDYIDNVSVIPHGFDRETFFTQEVGLPDVVEQKLQETSGDLRLLFVSHYNYFRNFDTLIRALPLIKNKLPSRRVRLVLTCELKPKPEWGPYDATGTMHLVQQLGVADDIVELALVPYQALSQVYQACDMYVTPAYAESFAHPLVEAMACGLPVAASDLAVHREVCMDAAVYFSRHSPEELSDKVVELVQSSSLSHELSQKGLKRAADFSWQKHVAELILLCWQVASHS